MSFSHEAKKQIGEIMLSEPRNMRLRVILSQKVVQVIEFKLTTETTDNGVPDIQETMHRVPPLGFYEAQQLQNILSNVLVAMSKLAKAMIDREDYNG
jgi:hypothetical protein